METFASKEYASMTEKLNDIRGNTTNLLQTAEQSFDTVKESLQKLRSYISGYSFADNEEEIRFFKKVLPSFLKELIYYKLLFDIELQKPVGNEAAQRKYYRRMTTRIQSFFARNRFLYWYYKTNQTNLDASFFLRNAKKAFFWQDGNFDPGSPFYTPAGYCYAKVQAYELMVSQLQQETPHSNFNPPDGNPTFPKLKWTDSKVSLIELAYAIQSRGSVNQGKADVKDLVAGLEFLFDTDLGNFYGVFQQNIRIRKKNRTVYLDQLKEYLERRMDECDENPRF